MHRVAIAACAAAAICCLAGSAGCCCCHPGFSLRGDWSLEMDRLPNNCGHGGCSQGHCSHGWAALGADHAELEGYYGVAPTTSPQFHPVPTAPIANVTAPLVAEVEHASAPPPKQVSVLKQDPTPTPAASSWMFVERQGSSKAPTSAELAERRRLAADGWSAPRRR